jgi:hypothetical protein
LLPAGHEFDYTGVFATSPRDAPGQGKQLVEACKADVEQQVARTSVCRLNTLPAVVFRESIYIGDTDLSQEEVQQLVFKLGQVGSKTLHAKLLTCC